MRFKKCVCLALCLHCIKFMLLGSHWSLMEAEEDFFLHSQYKVTTGFLSDFSPLSAEALEFDQSWRQTVGWCTLMFLKDWHSLSTPQTCVLLIWPMLKLLDVESGCTSPPDMYYSFMFVTPPPPLQSVVKATFSKCLAAVFKKSSAIEGTQAIGNTLLS